MPQISVIVPVYKAELYLEQCVQSILNQTFSDLELILVDDGSPDSCPEMCDKYAAMDSRVHVIHKNNAGVAIARNTGIEQAIAKYITFVDSDDYIDPEMYGSMMENAVKYDCDVVMCDCLKEFPNRSEPYTHEIRPGFYDKNQLREEYYPHLLMMENVEYPATISNCLMLFKRETARNIRYLPKIRFSEDLLFGAQLLYSSDSFYYMKGENFYHYRMNPTSATHTFTADKWKDYQKLHKEIKEYFGNCNEYDFKEQVDKVLLFFVYNAVGDLTGNTTQEKNKNIEQIRNILNDPDVRDMFKRLNVCKLPVSKGLKVVTLCYKYKFGLSFLYDYFRRKR